MDFLSLIGSVTVVYFLYHVLINLYHACTVHLFPSSVDFFKYGKWAVITGATDGIGKAIAFELAEKGQNIALISRSLEKLKRVAEEIKSKHKVSVKYLEVDFSNDEAIYDEIKDFLADMDVGVLVNNVGIGNDPSLFLDQSDLSKMIKDIVRINITAMLKMTEIVLPGMVARRRGLILNISSSACLIPLFSLYGATKAFVTYFSKNLAKEYKDKGISVQCVVSCFVRTKMIAGVTAKSMTIVEPEYFAKSLLASADKGISQYGCWQHALLVWLLLKFPINWIPFLFKISVDVDHLFQKKRD